MHASIPTRCICIEMALKLYRTLQKERNINTASQKKNIIVQIDVTAVLWSAQFLDSVKSLSPQKLFVY